MPESSGSDGHKATSLTRRNTNHPGAAKNDSSAKDHADRVNGLSSLLQDPSISDFSENAFQRHAELLGSSSMSQPVNATTRAAIMGKLQRDYGNFYVQRIVDHIQQSRAESVQTKLSVSPAGDKYEHEADSVAKDVMGKLRAPGGDPAQRQGDGEAKLQVGEVDQQGVGQDLAIERYQYGDAVQLSALSKKGIKAAEKGFFNSQKKRLRLANELMDGANVMDYATGVCQEAAAFVKYLLGADITFDELKETSAQAWYGKFNFLAGSQWLGQPITRGTAVGFQRVKGEEFFHVAIGVGGTTIRAVNGRKLGAGWVDDRDLLTELDASEANDGKFEYDGGFITVWLSNL